MWNFIISASGCRWNKNLQKKFYITITNLQKNPTPFCYLICCCSSGLFTVVYVCNVAEWNSCMFVFSLLRILSELWNHIVSTFQHPPVSHPWRAEGPLPVPVYFFTLSIFFASFLCASLKKMRGIGWSDLPFRWKREAFSLTLTLYLLWYFLNCNIKQHLCSPVLKWHGIFQLTLSSPVLHGLTESSMCLYLISSSKCFNLNKCSYFFHSWVCYIFKNK